MARTKDNYESLGLTRYQYDTRPVADDYEPSDRERMFIYHYVVDGMSAHEAAKEAGYTSSVKSDSYKRLQRLAPLIRKEVTSRMMGGAAKALSVLYSVMTADETPPSVKVKAATEWLDRSGYSKTVEVKFDDVTKQLEDYTAEELQEKLQTKAKRLLGSEIQGANVVDITNVVDGEVVDG